MSRPPLTRRQFLGYGLGGLAASLLGGAAQAYASAQLRREQVALRGLTSALRLAVLTDLHYGPLIGLAQVRSWVDLALSLCPDGFLLLGDFVDVALWEAMPAAYLAELGRLRAPLGAYGVWGNHDYGSFGRYRRLWQSQPPSDWEAARQQFAQALLVRGIRVLRNGGLPLRPDLYLGGVDDLWWGEPDAARALAAAPSGAARLLLSHNPDLLMNLDPQLLPPAQGLMLSGHTHGGQVRLPLVGALQVPSRYGQRFAQGWITGDTGARGFVSRGLGLSGLPLRNLCPPEIILLELVPAWMKYAGPKPLSEVRYGIFRTLKATEPTSQRASARRLELL